MTPQRTEFDRVVGRARAIFGASVVEPVVEPELDDLELVEDDAPEPSLAVESGQLEEDHAQRQESLLEANRPYGSRPTLESVRAELGECVRCDLHRGRRQIVFGVGDPDADLMIIGEAPGKHEDLLGEPFVGKAGNMLNDMLTLVLVLPRRAVYIANIVKCRPEGNRNPTEHESDCCRPFLEGQINAVRPKVILVMGTVALQGLFQLDHGITRNRGTWRDFRGIPVMPTFHPAYLLRRKEDKQKTFQDLLELKRRYDHLRGKRPPLEEEDS